MLGVLRWHVSAHNEPWLTEPDRVEWTHAGLRCLIRRVRSHGALCGYVSVPPEHSLFRLEYYDAEPALQSVGYAGAHGGLTFSGKFPDEDGFWLGFDCAHSGDFLPSMPLGICFESYRTVEYVTGEVNALADALRKVGAR